MAKLKATRIAQYPLVAEFTFNFDDTAVDSVAGTEKTFGSTFGQSLVFDAVNLPPNANVIGGEIVVETAWATSTAATLSAGDSVSANRYANAVDLKSAARTALTLTGFRGAGENIRLAVNTTVANATAGKATLRVMYTVQNRANETQPA
jgi:hypothetical protein